jgi:DNA polymerase elongation subunit (family B)
MLKEPHDLEYEKTFMPFALLAKKRYVGMLYEMDPNKCKRKSMGIVLKRRDNAPIVKDIYGGILDILMKKQDIHEAIEFTKHCIRDMLDEKIPMRKLIITKSLRGFYKNPRTIAHKVLAERIGKRDPGNKPKVGARIPFAYIQTKGKRLQGDKIEHPDFIKTHHLKLDYSIYITNQIMKPILQLFALPYVLDNIPSFRRRKHHFSLILEGLRQTLDEEKFLKKSIELRNKEVKKLIFDDFLRKAENKKKGHQNIKQFFKNV